jgi:hypothetical protein
LTERAAKLLLAAEWMILSAGDAITTDDERNCVEVDRGNGFTYDLRQSATLTSSRKVSMLDSSEVLGS